MISGIFGKTKPINYVLLLGLLSLIYWFSSFYYTDILKEPIDFLTQAFVLIILLFSVLVLDFVVNRNQITNTNAYTALYFVLLVLIFPSSVLDPDAIGCNFFLILASRRLISLRSLKYMKLKILDASLWVMAASIFYSWSLLFLILVFIAIYIYEPKSLKNWLVPLVGITSFVLIWNAILILAGKEGFFLEHYSFNIGDWKEMLQNWTLSSKLILFIVLITITGLAVFLKSGKLGLGRIINLRVISIYLTLSFLVVILSLTDGKFPILITFFPAAVFLGKYTEMIKRKNIRELSLSGAMLLSILIFVLDILFK
ncbi:hypothetical protein [Muriicola soli]|uniref:Beta-carotene 15,15'-monooxygenase n=1 Tax=Muriicola soli TaxID=2507538 RepID=A0A411ECD3_9FLAO|nr:hypothetical protein [Muriicola soli]QBA65416.1 hypothetical protein EQY75_13270 [Muriicola soli]